MRLSGFWIRLKPRRTVPTRPAEPHSSGHARAGSQRGKRTPAGLSDDDTDAKEILRAVPPTRRER